LPSSKAVLPNSILSARSELTSSALLRSETAELDQTGLAIAMTHRRHLK
jgi:hypothetical protein